MPYTSNEPIETTPMAKAKPVVSIETYGIHTTWDAKSKHLPKIKTFTTDVPAEIDIEFGFTVNIKKARGEKKSATVSTTRTLPTTPERPWNRLTVNCTFVPTTGIFILAILFGSYLK